MSNTLCRITFIALLLLASKTLAQDASSYIVVSGEGRVRAKPTSLSLNGVVIGTGDVTSDAVTKYLGAKRQAVEALEALKIEGLKISGGGFSIASSSNSNINPFVQQLQGRANNRTAAKVLVSESLDVRLKIKELDEDEVLSAVMKIIDTGKEVNMQFSGTATPTTDPFRRYASQQYIKFHLDDEKSLRKQAHAAAVADARQRAKDLAELTDLTIKGVRSIESTSNYRPAASAPTRSTQQGPTAMKEMEVSASVRMYFFVKPK